MVAMAIHGANNSPAPTSPPSPALRAGSMAARNAAQMGMASTTPISRSTVRGSQVGRCRGRCSSTPNASNTTQPMNIARNTSMGTAV
jgi:hypothetical protein